uniref:Uncharacterized protein n=1 Tax=Arundo donax TaxID=35708 RepID=A0A0A9GFN9_ARUDO
MKLCNYLLANFVASLELSEFRAYKSNRSFIQGILNSPSDL